MARALFCALFSQMATICQGNQPFHVQKNWPPLLPDGSCVSEESKLTLNDFCLPVLPSGLCVSRESHLTLENLASFSSRWLIWVGETKPNVQRIWVSSPPDGFNLPGEPNLLLPLLFCCKCLAGHLLIPAMLRKVTCFLSGPVICPEKKMW
ncbi:hypothetical protein OIU85_017776 [Salix viminalis]|uniref:Secreted protein n=1 Tax=Salix viminalis TaxID=40686 RepID=A0A9Q0VA64_SALVM|nr:hypothetical protein OIU85_017776 [Salix viminalis]